MRFLIFLLALVAAVTVNAQTKKPARAGKAKSVCSPDCEAHNGSTDLACNLTSADLQQRKLTVIASLKAKVQSRKALKNGYQYTFAGSDDLVDELTSFIKTERQCCSFFVFNLSISGDQSRAILEITGPKGAKEFIDAELSF